MHSKPTGKLLPGGYVAVDRVHRGWSCRRLPVCQAVDQTPVTLYCTDRFSTIDLFGVAKRYITEENFVEPADLEAPYADTRADMQLKSDTSFYRIINLAAATPNGYTIDMSSLQRRDRIVQTQERGWLQSGQTGFVPGPDRTACTRTSRAGAVTLMAKDSFPVLNMLNMKYVIVPDQQDRRNNTAILNPLPWATAGW